MAMEVGTNVLLYVGDGGSPTVFTALKGQQSGEFSGSNETDDITDKTHSGWGSTMNVLARATINVSGKTNWPDTTGIEPIRLAWQNRTTLECKLVFNAAGAHYRGFCHVTSFSISGTHLTATEYSFTMQNAEALVYAAS